MRKILCTSRHGAGWSSCNGTTPEQKRFACEYSPIIEAIERGESLDEFHPLVVQFKADFAVKFDGYNACVLGAKDLEVVEFPDGSILYISDDDGLEHVQLYSELHLI